MDARHCKKCPVFLKACNHSIFLLRHLTSKMTRGETNPGAFMTELDLTAEVEIEDFTDELSDEALDRGTDFGFSGHQGHWCWSGAPR